MSAPVEDTITILTLDDIRDRSEKLAVSIQAALAAQARLDRRMLPGHPLNRDFVPFRRRSSLLPVEYHPTEKFISQA